jgi:hypothetical protein
MSESTERIDYHGSTQQWIAALWCEYVLSYNPAMSETRSARTITYDIGFIGTFLRFPAAHGVAVPVSKAA